MIRADHLGTYAVEYVRSTAVSPDGSLVALGLADGLIQLWDASRWVPLATLYHEAYMCHVDAVAFSPDGRLLATGACVSIMLWDLATHRPAGSIAYPVDPPIAYQSWDVEDGVHWYNINPVPVRSDNRAGLGIWRFRAPGALAFRPDGLVLAAGAQFEGTIGRWNLRTGGRLPMLTGHTDHVVALAYSPTGDLLASASYDGSVRVWQVPGDSCLHILADHVEPVTDVTFSPDGTSLITAGRDGTVRRWSPSTGEQMQRLELGKPWCNCAAWSPDGALIAAGGWSSPVRLWDAERGQLLLELHTRAEQVVGLSFVDGGRRLFAAGWYLQGVHDEELGYAIVRAFGALDVWEIIHT